MGGLAHYLEDEGLAATQISLVRLHTEKIRPPRALWVPFELGRPLGPPNHPEFQTKVLLEALNLLEAESGPVLVDLPYDAPAADIEPDAWACPLPLPATADTDDGPAGLKQGLFQEIANLSSWYELAREKRGRTTFGVSGLAPDEIGRFLAGFLDGRPPTSPRPDLSLPWMVKLATEDLKAYYLEAITAQPGCPDPGGERLNDWFWKETTAARVFFALRDHFKISDDFWEQILANVLLVPVAQKKKKP